MPTVIEPVRTVIPVYTLAQSSGTGGTMIEVQNATGTDRGPGPDFLIPHRKDYYLFVLVRKGNSRHWVDLMPYTLKPDTFYFTIPPQVHLKEEVKPMNGLILRFTEDFLQLEGNEGLRQLPIIQNPSGGHELDLQPQDLQFVEEIMQKMLTEFGNSNSWKNQMLASLLRVLVIYLSRLYTQQFGNAGVTQERRLLKNFLSLVEQHHTSLHDVASYAGLLHLTPGYLTELVKQQSGKTVLAHIHERITVEVKRRLLHTSLSVKEISAGMGFQDAAYFHRWFKRITGITPAAYRLQIRKMYS